MSLKILLVLLLMFVLPGCTSQTNPKLLMAEHYYLTTDDQPGFSAPIVDRSTWQKIAFAGLTLKNKNIWVQIDFEVPTQATKPQGAFITLLASYQAWWDGIPIGNNGIVGNSKATETPGKIEQVLLISQHLLTPGKHTLSIKASMHHNQKKSTSGMFWTFIGDYQQLTQLSYKRANIPMAMSGALLLSACYCLLLYFTTLKSVSYLWFSSLCFTILLLFVVESWRGLWGYTYDWHIPRLDIVLWLSCSVSLLLTLFVAFFFELPKKSRLLFIGLNLLLQTVLMLSINGYDNRSLLVILIGAIVCALICVHALFLKQKNALLMLVGLILFIAPLSINTHYFMEQYFFFSFATLIGLMLYSLSQTIQSKQKQLVQSQINASRLELELVKRNLQPHFILNTLTAVEEWIEESPATAVKFINALADEFRFMAQMSPLPFIALKDEIALCQSHLKVMEYRSNTEFDLIVQAEQLQVQLPPGILLTLVENAISHNNYRQGKIIFTLTQTLQNAQCTLIFTAPVTAQSSTKMINAGTGTAYIEARLTESFSTHWKMQASFDSLQSMTTMTMTMPCQLKDPMS